MTDDSSTLLKTSNIEAVISTVCSILSSEGFRRAEHSPEEFHAAYTPLAEVSSVSFWIGNSHGPFIRLYCSLPGIFTWHPGDGVTFLCRLCAALDTYAVDVCTDDGCFVAAFETNGSTSRLSGYHSYMLDDTCSESGEMMFVPGMKVYYRGVPLSWSSFELNFELFQELVGFSADEVGEVIAIIERQLFGLELPSYFSFLTGEANRYHLFHFER